MTDEQFETQKARVLACWEKWRFITGVNTHWVHLNWERNKDDDNRHTLGSTQADWQYRQVYVFFYLPKIVDLPDDELDNLVLHEMSHVLIRSAYTTEEYSDKVEFATENVARAIEDAYNAGRDSMKHKENISMANQANEQTDQPPKSFGQKAAGVSFNPSGHPLVNDIKQKSAELIDLLNNARNSTEDNEEKRMYSVAITEVQTAQMWGVKAATWGLN